MTAPRDEIDRLGEELRAARRHITELEAQLQGRGLSSPMPPAAHPPGSPCPSSARCAGWCLPKLRRQQTLHKAASRTLTLVDRGPSALAGLIRRDRDLRRAIGVADTAAARRRQYRRWLALHTPERHAARDHAPRFRADADAPVISLIMPVHNPERGVARGGDRIGARSGRIRTSNSASPMTRRQRRTCAPCSTPRQPILAFGSSIAISRVVSRPRRIRRSDLAAGEFVAFIDNDDVLRPHALYSMAAYLREHPDADLVYSDEDKLLPDGSFGAPTFKPDFSPDRLLAENYINHFTHRAPDHRQGRSAGFARASTAARITTSCFGSLRRQGTSGMCRTCSTRGEWSRVRRRCRQASSRSPRTPAVGPSRMRCSDVASRHGSISVRAPVSTSRATRSPARRRWT